LWFCLRLFESGEGVEVTPSCIAFARQSLGVELLPAIREDGRYGVVTAWHSLEHLPPASLKGVVAQLHSVTTEAFIVSVPNAGSWAAAWFHGRYPYHDAAAHYHQFTAKSLQLLLEHAGWRRHCWFRLGIYSLFCYAQGLLNCATNTHNILYFQLKRGRTVGALSSAGLLWHLSLLAALLPVAIVLTMVDYACPDRAACLNIICYKANSRQRLVGSAHSQLEETIS
jgi:hypothetical protein